MMMESLEAGGLHAVYSKKRNEKMNNRWGEPAYLPNDNYYELEIDDYTQGDLAERYEGKLVKCLYGGAIRLPPGEYRIIFMRRSAEEIRASLFAFFGDDAPIHGFSNFDKAMDDIIGILRDRRSFKTVDVFNYNDVVNNPRAAFASLDWPIDVDAAAAIPTKLKRRFSSEGDNREADINLKNLSGGEGAQTA